MDKKTVCCSISLLVAFNAGCGGGGGNDNQNVSITSTSRCMGPEPRNGNLPYTYPQIVDPTSPSGNCMLESIERNVYETDQIAIHLFGTSPAAKKDSCPPTPLTLGGGPLCFGSPVNYEITWKNTENNAEGRGSITSDAVTSLALGVNWRTWSPINETVGNGIPLDIGSNKIQISVNNDGSTGKSELNVIRVIDVTPPTVVDVLPEPDSNNSRGRQITVFISEQLDPASVVSAVSVRNDIDEIISGVAKFDDEKLEITWLPDSDLASGTTYTARVSGVTDWAPNIMVSPYEWSFTIDP